MTILSLDLATFISIFAVILIGGTVKGALGIGLPAVAMSTLPFLIDPVLAVTILSVPILLTNAQQVLTVPGWRDIVKRFVPAAVTLVVTIFLVSLWLDDAPSRLIALVVGISLSLFAITALMNIRLPVSEALGWQVLTGLAAGITGGLSAVKSPVMIYCAALELPRKEFVAATGFLFFSGGVGMGVGLAVSSLLNPVTLPLSLIAVVVAMTGFQIGAWLGRRINAVLFRKLLLGVMLVLGLRMIVMNLI